MSLIQCRLKQIDVHSSVWKQYHIPLRHNSIQFDYIIRVEKKSPPKVTPYTQDECQELFPKIDFSKPLVLEVGCGTGEFLIDAARNHPEKNFIGIDIALPCIQRAVKQVDDSKGKIKENQNILFYSGLVNDFLAHDFLGISFDEMMVNFPDPWPKKKHLKRRIICREFLELCYQSLKPEGTLYTATDVLSLHDYHLEMLEAFKKFKFTNLKNEMPKLGYYEFVSKYQQKNLADSHGTFYTSSTKKKY